MEEEPGTYTKGGWAWALSILYTGLGREQKTYTGLAVTPHGKHSWISFFTAMTLTKVVFPEYCNPTSVSSISSFQNRDLNQSSSLLMRASMVLPRQEDCKTALVLLNAAAPTPRNPTAGAQSQAAACHMTNVTSRPNSTGA